MSKETLGWAIILTSPIWLPIALALTLLVLPIILLLLVVLVLLQRWYGI